MNTYTNNLESRLLPIVSGYLNGQSYMLIYPLASKLEVEMNLLFHKTGSASEFDKNCEFLSEVSNSVEIETSKIDIQNHEANQIARINRFIENGYFYQVSEIQMSQLIYRLIKDFIFLQGKVLPVFKLFMQENSKRLRTKRWSDKKCT